MAILLLILQAVAGLASLGLLTWSVIKAGSGHPSRKLARWTLGFSATFVVLTILVTRM